MADIQQADVVGNYLANYYGAQDRVQKQQDAQYQRQRQMTQDARSQAEFDQNSQVNALNMAMTKHKNLVNLLGRASDEASFQQSLQMAALPPEQGGLGLDPSQLSHLSYAKDFKRLQQESGALGEQLDLAYKQAQIGSAKANTAQSYAAADAARANTDYIRSGKPMAGGKPLAPAVQAAEDKDIEAVQGARTLQQKTAGWINAFTKGGLETGPVSQATRILGKATGFGTTNSRQLELFQADLESMRNDSLRLNSGVQTEGDAIREWNTLVGNINDQQAVVQSLKRINEINKRAEALKLRSLQIRRARNPGTEPFDPNSLNVDPSANLNYQTGPAAGADDFSDVDKLLGLK